MAQHFLKDDRLKTVRELLNSALHDTENGWSHYETALTILKTIYKNNVQDSSIKFLVSQLRRATWPQIKDIPNMELNITPETFDALKTPHHYENFRRYFASINTSSLPHNLKSMGS